MTSWVGPDGWSSSKQNTVGRAILLSFFLSSTSSCRAGTIRGVRSRNRWTFLTAVMAVEAPAIGCVFGVILPEKPRIFTIVDVECSNGLIRV